MTRHFAMDLLAVARMVGLSMTCIGLIVYAIGFVASFFASLQVQMLSSAIGAHFIVPGLSVILVASLSRVFVRRMKFES